MFVVGSAITEQNRELVDAVAAAGHTNGWSFIPFEDALTDEVYRLKYDYAGVRGAGHLDAIKPPTR